MVVLIIARPVLQERCLIHAIMECEAIENMKNLRKDINDKKLGNDGS